MFSDLDCAKACWNSYFNVGYFDAVYYGPLTDNVWCGIKIDGDTALVVFRGSTTIQDWLRDFQSVMTHDPELGDVEYGFMTGLRTVEAFLWKQMCDAKEMPTKILVTGHSLGAARAQLFAGLLTCHGKICELVGFGPPRAGGPQLRQLLNTVKCRLYKNRADPVTDVPFTVPLLFDYEHVSTLIHIDAAPKPFDPWGILADHHSELYVTAMQGQA